MATDRTSTSTRCSSVSDSFGAPSIASHAATRATGAGGGGGGGASRRKSISPVHCSPSDGVTHQDLVS